LAIRIYALAKELKIDNKKLVDICAKAGITGKGSALASLSDEEVARLKAHLSGGKGAKEGARAGGGTATATMPRTIRREDYIAPAGNVPSSKVPVLPPRPKAKPVTPAAPAPPVARAPIAPSPLAPAAPPLVEEPAIPLITEPVVAPPEAEPVFVAEPVVVEDEEAVIVLPAEPVAAESTLPLTPEVAEPVAEEPKAEPVEPVPAPAVEPVVAEAPPAEPMAAKEPAVAPEEPPRAAEPPMPSTVAPVRAAPPAAAPVTPMAPKAMLPSRPSSKTPTDKSAGKKPLGGRVAARKSGERPAPMIHLAPMPTAQKPPARPKSKEPAPQKPDIKLPLDAIRASKQGMAPLSEQLRKHEEKRKEREAAKKTSPRKPASPEGEETPVAAPEAPGLGRDRRRIGRAAAVEGEEEGAKPAGLGGREQRQLKRKRTAPAKRREGEEEEGATTTTVRRRTHIQRTGANTAAPRKGKVMVELPTTVRAFSEAIGVPKGVILGKLLALGVVSNIAAGLEAEMAELLAAELGADVDFRREVALEDKVLESLEQPDDPAALCPRPPIVTFLGHVDHGKTSLLDRIIGIDVAAHEKGGITQHIRAYRVQKDGRAVTFVDTPGHEAFTEMRARGANVTDIAVLVVAADDGVMPQTEEAISHARAAGVPIVVALNKIDLPGVNVDRVYQQLATNELLPAEWGGETELVRTSATKGTGIDDLLETLLTVAELHEYRANPDRPGTGTCLESEMHEDRGVVAKMLVQNGTLRVGDVVCCGSAYGRIKAMYDTLDPHKKYQEAGPSTPVNVTGLNVAPGAGDRFYVLPDISEARQLAESRAEHAREVQLSGGREHVTLENLFERLGRDEEVQTLNIILRADVRGSIEAIRKELGKLQHPEVQIKILQATVGGVTEADVHLADASDAVIIAFNVVADEKARILAEARGVQVRRYDIIYQVTGDLKAALEGMLRPEKLERELGRALVQQVFHISRVGVVAGCRVLTGTIQRDGRVRVIRESRIVGDYAIETLRREKDDAREVREGMECGIKLAGFNDVKEGDVLEVYKIEEVKRTLEDGRGG